jgi:ribonucleoside-diphosphate reductase alpha chain
MDISNRILSDITVFQKYAKYLPELNRRETWEELVTRNKEMHQSKYPQLHDEIESAYKFVYDKKVLPSMRSLQFGGKPIEINPSRIYNCSYLPIDDWRAFGEVMFLLLGGTGVGFSVQKHHVEKLPPIHKPKKDRERRFLVGDSIEGWADAIKAVVKSYFFSGSSLRFDYSDIRPKGTRLITSGGKAPGPEPLRICIEKIRSILELKHDGENLTPLEVHDIICHIADAVLAGGIRRAALISLFSADDNEMISCKFGAWWELNPQRGRANNSAVLLRSKITEEFFKELWKKIELSNAGEPGIYFSNDKDWGTNPCCEIALRPFQMCNLCEVNASDVVDQQDLEDRVRAAAFIGTLQASYTEFHYLRPIWQRTCEKDALLGIGMTGIGSGVVQKLDVKTSAKIAKEENERVANLLGINKAARVTCIKPSGTTSCVLGTSSGIHAWHNDYYIRRIRIGKNEALYNYLIQNHPQLVEDEYFRPHDTAVVGVPQKAPDHAIMRTESPIQLLERVKWFSQQWIRQGHRSGMNTHNISATVSIREHEWDAVGNWMWSEREHFNGLSVLPFDGGSYIQAPFQDITKEEYERLMETLHDVDLTQVIEFDDQTELAGEIACGALGCEIK